MKSIVLAAVTVALGATPAFAEAGDLAGATDHPLFTRMPGFVISEYDTREFNSVAFTSTKGREEKVEGRYFYFEYRLKSGEKDPGGVAIKRNYVNAAKRLGARVTLDEPARAHLVVSRGTQETWVGLSAYGTSYRLVIVEKAGMVQVVVANADALASGLATAGHASVGGILFDTGKSALKPESAEAIAEVAKLLKQKEALKLAVVGHTDNVGDAAANAKLSNERAAAVMKELFDKHGVAAARLTSFGAGPYSPVASNATEEGRALNRRVEIVER